MRVDTTDGGSLTMRGVNVFPSFTQVAVATSIVSEVSRVVWTLANHYWPPRSLVSPKGLALKPLSLKGAYVLFLFVCSLRSL